MHKTALTEFDKLESFALISEELNSSVPVIWWKII